MLLLCHQQSHLNRAEARARGFFWADGRRFPTEMVATGQGGCIPLGIIRNETFNSTSCCCPYPSSSSSPLSPWPGSIDMLSSDWMAEGVAEVGLCLTDLTQLKPHPNLISTHQSIAETSPKHQHCLQGEISSKLCPKPILTSKPTVGRRKKVETWIKSGSFVGKGATNVVEQNGKVVQKMQIRKLGNEKKVRTTLVWQSWPTNWYGGEGLLN